MTALSQPLPRLLYLADVPVEASYHGSALLYRLLEDYPKERLRIIEAGVQLSKQERRIDGITYNSAVLPFERISRTRLFGLYQAASLRLAERRVSSFLSLARDFVPEAILTVTHGFSWIAAAALARRLEVPLHLICHDDWPHIGDMQAWKDRVFGDIYRGAASRLCVSPFMAREYERRYSAPGAVLYPSRAKTNEEYQEPQVPRVQQQLCGAFAGASLRDHGNRVLLRHVSNALKRLDGQLKIFGPFTDEELNQLSLGGKHVRAMGLVPSAELIETLRGEADFVVAPLSFFEEDRHIVSYGFPSKLTDYTAAGVPILAIAPSYSSLAMWCRLEPEAAVLVESDDVASIERAIASFRDPAKRQELARGGIDAGRRYFSAQAGAAVFSSALLGPRSRVSTQKFW